MAKKTNDASYAKTCANRIAASYPQEDAALRLAEAIVNCKEHDIYLYHVTDDNTVELTYYNHYGPTCSVDDVLEQMILLDYKDVCEQVMRLLLELIGRDRVRLYRFKVRPTVSFTPEEDTSVIDHVTIRFNAPKRTYDELLKAVAYREVKE